MALILQFTNDTQYVIFSGELWTAFVIAYTPEKYM